ncbi:hypothetical protein SAMN05443667_101241 [Flavobacterium gillisiae]|uniref:Uncharacterized protein n=1 Tax=Flavobacterium gillisiae TaxID=150146 RepID=A0A1H3WTW3_9FLAO|nr:hypothetical protein [Flavobacterium gillisiae]SDZ90607.1 hypothetical protein SAMN05443667_101241 [Flavobacterium gillisiae]
MKKAIAYFFSILIVLLFASVFLVSCKAKQPLRETSEKTVINYDSIYRSKISIKNKAINDSLLIVIGKVKTERKECDSVCQIAIDRLLSQLNTKKTSGDNSYSVFYDPGKNTLNLNSVIGETKSDTVTLFRYITKTITLSTHKDVPVETPLPKWQLYLMIFGAGTIGYLFVKLTIFIRSKIPT